MSNTPSDAELEAFADAFDWDGWIAPALAKRAFARAVLAKWGAPQPVMRAPLTEEQIASAWRQWDRTAITSASRAIAFVRFCGITQKGGKDAE